MSPNNKPSTGTPIQRKTQSIKGAMDVFDDSFPNIPGATSKNKMIIGGHTYSHPFLNTLSLKKIEIEVERNVSYLSSVINKKISSFRFARSSY